LAQSSAPSDAEAIDNDVNSGKTDRAAFNYSIQEFIYYNQEKVSQNQVRAAVANVLKAFCAKYPSIGYAAGMNKIVLFLVSLMDESSAFWLFSYIVNFILPKQFYSKSNQGIPLYGFQIEKNILKNLAMR